MEKFQGIQKGQLLVERSKKYLIISLFDYITCYILCQCYCYIAWKYTHLKPEFAKDFMRRSFSENFNVTDCFDYLIGAPFPKQTLENCQVYLL